MNQFCSKIFQSKNIEYKEIFSGSGKILTKLIKLIFLLDYSTIYRAILNKTDPSPILSIDFIKKKYELIRVSFSILQGHPQIMNNQVYFL